MNSRTNRCAPNHKIAFNQLVGEKSASHDHSKIAFQMSNLGNSRDNRNIDDFGGVPFINHMGNHCHRGATAFKKSDFHPMDTAKRVIYRNDGSGRDGYIAKNSGGLTINNFSGVNGTDVQTQYAAGLREYRKDNVSPGYHRLSTPLRIAEHYIEKKLKPEDADYSGKFSRKIGQMIQYQNIEKRSPKGLSESVDVNSRNNKSQYNTIQTDYENANQVTSNEIKGLLWDYSLKLSKHDMYFRNQDRLMRNAAIPQQEIFKMNQKMKFQTKHSEILSIPKASNARKKYESINQSPVSMSMEASRSRFQYQMPAGFMTSKDLKERAYKPSSNMKALLRARPSLDPSMPGSLLVGQGTSFNGAGPLQSNLSKSLQQKFQSTILKTDEQVHKERVKEAIKIQLKNKLKPIAKKDDPQEVYGNILAKKLKTVEGLF